MKTGLRIALELTELGARLRAQRYRRENPEASEEEVVAVVAAWRADRSIAPDGDAVGRASTWQNIR
jgi:hypothetical protein